MALIDADYEIQQCNELTSVENYHHEGSCYTAIQGRNLEQSTSRRRRDYNILTNVAESADSVAVACTSDNNLPCNVVIPSAVLLLAIVLLRPLYSLA